MSARSYSDAIDVLNSLQSNAASIDALLASGSMKTMESIVPVTLDYLRRLGYSANDLNRLNVVHITGTKGKGSTSAFTDSILRHAKPEWKVGLYTSPHLVTVRERIRINSVPLSEEQFSSFFFEVWDELVENREGTVGTAPRRPGYFRMLTLVAFHAFLSLNVDVTVLEVGIGGRNDPTNVVPRPVATGITALGLDHVSILGTTIKEIAWQKGGIYKEGVPALTVEQPEEGITILKHVAEEVKASSFSVVERIPKTDDVKLGLAGSHQYQNAALAVELSRVFLRSRANLTFDGAIPEPFKEGLAKTRWPGRCQTVRDPAHFRTTWFLDGAHTYESLECAVEWFVAPDTGLRGGKGTKKILIFNCTSGRSGASFLENMFKKAAEQLAVHKNDESPSTLFDTVIFCTNVAYLDIHSKESLTPRPTAADGDPVKVQSELAAAWLSLVPEFPRDKVHVLPSVEHAIRVVRGIGSEGDNEEVRVLVTGSLHLIGGVIEAAGLSDVAL